MRLRTLGDGWWLNSDRYREKKSKNNLGANEKLMRNNIISMQMIKKIKKRGSDLVIRIQNGGCCSGETSLVTSIRSLPAKLAARNDASMLSSFPSSKPTNTNG
jgi:hypothetical protein